MNGLSKSGERENTKGKFHSRYAEMEMIEKHPSRKEKVLREMYKVAQLQGIIEKIFKQFF